MKYKEDKTRDKYIKPTRLKKKTLKLMKLPTRRHFLV